MIKELNQDEVLQKLSTKQSFFLYMFTPLCGTCNVSKRMLDIAIEIVKDKDIVMCNANFAQDVSLQFEIQSVPCLLLFSNGELKERHYALKDIQNTISILSVDL